MDNIMYGETKLKGKKFLLKQGDYKFHTRDVTQIAAQNHTQVLT